MLEVTHKKERTLNLLFGISVWGIVVIVILLLLSNFEFKNEQRRLVSEEAMFIGLTKEECTEILGEPLIDYGSEVYYDGGYEWTIEMGTLFCYEEYQTKMYLDENGLVESVVNEWTLDLIL